MLDRIRTRIRSRGKSVQYDRQRVTYEDGSKRVEPFYIEGQYEIPESDDYPILLPGRYGEIRRVDGRLDEEMRRYETEDAQEYYEQQRETERVEEEADDAEEWRATEPAKPGTDRNSDSSEEERRRGERLGNVADELDRLLDDHSSEKRSIHNSRRGPTAS